LIVASGVTGNGFLENGGRGRRFQSLDGSKIGLNKHPFWLNISNEVGGEKRSIFAVGRLIFTPPLVHYHHRLLGSCGQ